MNENYFVKREIIAQFPPANEKEKNPIVSKLKLIHAFIRIQFQLNSRFFAFIFLNIYI